MNLIIRIDDRLIHGQVTAGWVRPLGIEQIILANDLVASDEWERNLYTLAVPPEVVIKIFSITDAVEFIKNYTNNKKTMMLINSLYDALKIVESGIKVSKINIGGLHFGASKKQLATYIFFSDDDINYSKKIIANGVILEGYEIPGSPKIIINNVI